jgi:hypothetical protein
MQEQCPRPTRTWVLNTVLESEENLSTYAAQGTDLEIWGEFSPGVQCGLFGSSPENYWYKIPSGSPLGNCPVS